MTDFQVTLNGSQLKDLLTRDDGLQTLVEDVLNQVLEAQMTEHIGAERHERSEGRQAYRNGHRLRQLYSRVGTLSLRVPQNRDGGRCSSSGGRGNSCTRMVFQFIVGESEPTDICWARSMKVSLCMKKGRKAGSTTPSLARITIA